MKITSLLFFVFFTVFSAGITIAQPITDRTELEKERKQIQKELQEAQQTYNQLKGQSKQAFGQLSAVNRKIELQQSYINNIGRELKFLEDDIYLSNLEIYRLQKQLDTLKAEYAKTIVYAYKNRSSYNYLNFIFSAKSFNDALKRIKYLKSYRSYREKQVTTIKETQLLIAQRQDQQKGRVVKQSNALDTRTKEKDALDEQRKEKDVVLKSLKSQEKDLQKVISTKRKRDREVQNAITAIIKRIQKEEEAKAKAALTKQREDERKRREAAARQAEIDKAKTTPSSTSKEVVTTKTTTTPPVTKTETKPVAKEPEATKPVSYFELNDKDIALGANFATNKGRLPWPVDNGVVAIGFGTYDIESTILKGYNPGISVATSVGATVKAVFDGQVAGVHDLGDGNVMVTLRHGKYFTTYSNITNVSIAKGSVVKTGQTIGKAGRNDDGNGGLIDFILMIESKNVNPQQWLRR